MNKGYKISWLIPQRVIYVHAWGRHDGTSMKAYGSEIRQFLEHGIAPVHILTDDRDVTMMPTLSTVQDALSFSRDPKIGWIVALGTSNRMIEMGSRLISRIFNINYARVEATEDGISFLIDKDSSLKLTDIDRSVLAEN